MRELTPMECHEVSGGTNSSSSGSAIQNCIDLANGTTECTSVNGNTTVINTYDKNGNLTNTLACTENSTFKIKVTLPKMTGVEGGKYGGSSCEPIRPQTRKDAPPIEEQWVVTSPFTGAP